MGNAAARPAAAAEERAGFLAELRELLPRVIRCAESGDLDTVRFTAMILSEETAKPSQRAAVVELGGVRLLAPLAESSDLVVRQLAALSMAQLSSDEQNQASGPRALP